ncbi:MAG: glycine cleavage T C-terminal barrel domain-containing protein [Gammaproteobacteria bacterium]
MSSRLPPHAGEWIDRSQTIDFSYEGERIEAFRGDVISSAVMAGGRRILARSFKYHRPRGVLSLANHDANVLVETCSRTNIRADVVAPEAGAEYRAVNTWGGVRCDAGQVLGLLAPLLPAGFYYKAFYRPACLFPWWEKLIRRAAGLGRVDTQATAARVPGSHRWCDVLVIGAGASGLAAARRLAAAGVRVVLADEQARPGGSLRHLRAGEAGARELLAELPTTLADVTVLSGHVAAAYYPDHGVPLVGPDGITFVHARRVIVATGLYEQPAVFRNNDLPGVMLTGAAARLAHLYAVRPFATGVMLAGHPQACAQAVVLRELGVPLEAVIDLGNVDDAALEAARAAGLQVIADVNSIEARASGGELAALTVRAHSGGLVQTLDCDGAVMSMGWAPAASLLVQAGARMAHDAAVGHSVPQALPPGVFAAGSVNGVFALADRRADGAAAAAAALASLGRGSAAVQAPPRARAPQSHPYPVFPHPRGKAFVDFDEDLTIGDLHTAVREGFDAIELVKRYTTIGMGPSQGKTSNMNGLRIVAGLTGQSVGAVGATTPRPFVYPVPMAQLAGRRLRRVWRTPLHDWHVGQAAQMKEAGTWLRPLSYGAGPSRARIEREYAAVRGAVGLIDVSTLGKLEIFGRDARALLDYAYPVGFARLVPGMTRYVFMTDGGGTLVDDGVCACLGTDHYYLTTTSSQAQHVLRQLELYAAQLELEVAVVERTFNCGALNLAGPDARRVLAAHTDVDLSASAFPYLACREGTVAGVPARLMRVGFVGELGYEIHVNAHALGTLWQALCDAGAAHGLLPFGVDTQRLLRLDKGHVIVGHDSDGTTNPFEVGLGRAIAKSKTRCVGRHALAVLGERVTRQLIGFSCADPRAAAIEECHLVIDGERIAGRVTSVGWSPHCAAVIGLAMVENPLAVSGERCRVRVTDRSLIDVEVVPLPFYDPGNTRQHDTTEEAGHGG